MPKATKKTLPATKSTTPSQQRLWLMFPPKLIKQPLVWQVGHKFKIVRSLRVNGKNRGSFAEYSRRSVVGALAFGIENQNAPLI